MGPVNPILGVNHFTQNRTQEEKSDSQKWVLPFLALGTMHGFKIFLSINRIAGFMDLDPIVNQALSCKGSRVGADLGRWDAFNSPANLDSSSLINLLHRQGSCIWVHEFGAQPKIPFHFQPVLEEYSSNLSLNLELIYTRREK